MYPGIKIGCGIFGVIVFTMADILYGGMVVDGIKDIMKTLK